MASFCSHEPCVVIKGVSLQIQLTELKFPPKGVWAIPLQMKWGAQGRAATPSYWKEPPKCVGHLNRTPRGHYQGEAYFCFDCCRNKTVEVQNCGSATLQHALFWCDAPVRSEACGKIPALMTWYNISTTTSVTRYYVTLRRNLKHKV